MTSRRFWTQNGDGYEEAEKENEYFIKIKQKVDMEAITVLCIN